MEWYWWILILAGLAGFVFLKVTVGGAWMKNRKMKKEQRDKMIEDED